MEEYLLWEKIFNVDDDIELENLLKLVVFDYEARNLVFEKILSLKNQPKQVVKINVNIDKSLKDFDSNLLIKTISNDIIKQLSEKMEINKISFN